MTSKEKDAGTPNTKSLVLVLGAGASADYGLPIGSTLKQQISDRLDIFYETGRQTRGDTTIAKALRGLSNYGTTYNDLISACRHIARGLPSSKSIDNFIDSLGDSPAIALCGKLGIASAILGAERDSSLYIDPHNTYNEFDHGRNQTKWFNHFFQALTEGCRTADLPTRLRSIGVISFNYDRCFEHFLYHALQSVYGLKEAAAADYANMVDVYHPYGRVGALPWASSSGMRVPFGQLVYHDQLNGVASLLRTFTEGADPNTSDVTPMREMLATAQRVVFLGFAFHPLNMKLLFPAPVSVPVANLRAIGTAAGVSEDDAAIIREELAGYLRCTMGTIVLRRDLNCDGVWAQYSRTLGFRF